MRKVILIFVIMSMALAVPTAFADQLGDREPRDDRELIDLNWWMRGACWVTPFWETSSFWDDVWSVVGGRGEWWR